MDAIKNVIQDVIQDLSTRKPQDDPEAWLKKAFTKRELGHIKLGYFKRGIFCVLVDSSAWLYQLSLNKEVIATKLKKISKQITDVRLRLGEM